MKRLVLILIILLSFTFALFSQGARSDEDYELELFSNIDNAMMQAENSPTVLFFHASWCPSCKAAERDILANFEQLDGIVVLLVDYDSSSALKRKYGVTYQHTFVQISSTGEKINLWNGGGLDEILENVIGKEMP